MEFDEQLTEIFPTDAFFKCVFFVARRGNYYEAAFCTPDFAYSDVRGATPEEAVTRAADCFAKHGGVWLEKNLPEAERLRRRKEREDRIATRTTGGGL